MAELVAGNELSLYAESVEQLGIKLRIALADRKAVFQHSVGAVLFLVLPADRPVVRRIVIIEPDCYIIMEIKRFFLIRPAFAHS